MINLTIDEMEKVEAPVLEGLIASLESQIQIYHSSILKLQTMKKVLRAVCEDKQAAGLKPEKPKNYDPSLIYPKKPKAADCVPASFHQIQRSLVPALLCSMPHEGENLRVRT